MMISLELQSIALDYALPAIVVIGTGLLSYMLTGGVDEYPISSSSHVNSANVRIETVNGGDEALHERSRYPTDRSNNVR